MGYQNNLSSHPSLLAFVWPGMQRRSACWRRAGSHTPPQAQGCRHIVRRGDTIAAPLLRAGPAHRGSLTWRGQPLGLSGQSPFPLRYKYSTMLTQALFMQENPLNACKYLHALLNRQTAAFAVFKGLTLGDTSTFPQWILPSGKIPDLH